MGSSARRRNEKRMDFQKAKLKVGKTRPKSSNVTETRFKSKGITLREQSLSVIGLSATFKLMRQISFLSSHSDTQRRDALKSLSNVIASRSESSSLYVPVGTLMPKLLPLIVDSNDSVRDTLVSVLKLLRPEEIEDHIETILLFIRAGMTHLAVACQITAVEVLAWALDYAGAQLVSCSGGWIKTLQYFCAMLGWHAPHKVSQPAIRGLRSDRLIIKSLLSLKEYLKHGLVGMKSQHIIESLSGFPLCRSETCLMPDSSNPFTHLNLFGPQRDYESRMYPELDDRRRAFRENMLNIILAGLEEVRRQGGEAGRAAAACQLVTTGAFRASRSSP